MPDFTRCLLIALLLCGGPLHAESRLIAADAGATELLLALGLGPRLVAVDVTSRLPADHPPLPNIGYHRNLSAEGLLSLAPTAVVASEALGPPEVVTALERAGVQLVTLRSALDATQLRDNIRALAAALDQRSEGEQLVAKLDAQLRILGKRPVTGPIAFLLAMEPGRLRLAGAGTAGDALIRLLGSYNVARFDNYRSVSAESLLAMAPAAILVAGRDDNAAAELLAAHPLLAATPAGSRGHIVSVDGRTLVAGLSIAAVAEAQRLSVRLTGEPQ